MKEWKKPKAFAVAYSAQKRFLAFVLTFAMLFTSVGTDLNVSYAAQGNKVDFEIYGSELVDAINQAVESDNVVTPDSLEFTNGAIDKFETLFYGEGKVYEVYPQIDGGDMDAELRVFVRLPEEADDMYMVTGDEEVIFLYVNNGDETISCATRIIRFVDGEEKVKTTKRINVKSYEDKFGDEEVNIVSRKDETVEETTAAEEKTQETASDATSKETAAEEKETEVTEETTEAATEEATEAVEETTDAETEETAAEAEEKTEAETEQETAEETEKETSEEAVAAEGEVTASVSRHYAPVVAMKEDAEAAPEKETAEAVETEKEVVETEKETTEAVEKETAEAVETEKETTEAENKDAEVAETETEVTDETSETEETAEETSKEETTAESKENEETEAAKETQTETSKAAETTAEAKEEEPKKAEAATDNDLVGIGYCSTAKAYTTTVSSLKALDDIQGLKVTYAINPEYSARIVDGPRGVEEGEALVFGVKNQIGYAIESVTANGEFLEADSTSENEDGSVTAWYSVPEVTEEQEIEVYMTETGEHPEFNAELTMEDGTIITLHAAEGVLPAGVTAEATVKDNLAATVKEKLEAEDSDKGAVKAVVAYDINLMLDGNKLDNNWSQNGSVEVTFSGNKIRDIMADATVVEIYTNRASDDGIQTTESSDELDLEQVLTEEIAESGKESVTFEAKHFTDYIQVTRESDWWNQVKVTYHSNNTTGYWGNITDNKTWEDTTSKGATITFPEYVGDNGSYNNTWHFVGWSTNKNANASGNYTSTVYKPNDTWRVSADGNTIDFYAIWAQKDVDATFYIRLDGQIPTEPQSHENSEYATVGVIKNALKSAAFYTDSTNGVDSYLNETPTDSQIKSGYAKYDSNTQYVLWYVIKLENNGWHVDGVLLNKAKVNLSYNPNCATGEWVSGTMPDGEQYVVNSEVTISDKVPKRLGYTFTGWNTAADGSGTSYNPSGQFVIKENTTLYAQWVENDSVQLTYIAKQGGSVNRESENVAPSTGIPQGSVATAAKGYKFVNWTLGDTATEVSQNATLTKDNIDLFAKSNGLYVETTFKANFVIDENQTKELSYTVKHVVNGEDRATFTDETKTTVQVLKPNTLTRNTKLEADQKYEGYVKDKVTYEDGTAVTGDTIKNGAVIVVKYEKDTNSDQIPDIYQIIFTYESDGNGTVKYVSENSIKAVSAEGIDTLLDITEVEGKVYEVHTFVDENGDYVVPNSPVYPEAEIEVNPADKYAFDFWDIDKDIENKDYHKDMSVFRAVGYTKDTVFTVYFDKDEIGTNPGAPTTPDGVPDMYQIVFKYISENPSYGTVDGAAVIDGYVMEVVTRPTKEDGSYDMEAAVHPFGKVTVTGIGSYVFNHWSDDDTNYADANEIAGKGFTADTTFVAHFSYNGGNNNGGGNGGNSGGNGGSSSGGGSGSSSSGSIKNTSGGPGAQTVTIDAGNVPLAELPDAPASPVEIDDGEVPLAALPKTGQTTMKLTITLMFSGIFLALTAMSKKHKEEES